MSEGKSAFSWAWIRPVPSQHLRSADIACDGGPIRDAPFPPSLICSRFHRSIQTGRPGEGQHLANATNRHAVNYIHVRVITDPHNVLISQHPLVLPTCRPRLPSYIDLLYLFDCVERYRNRYPAPAHGKWDCAVSIIVKYRSAVQPEHGRGP